MIKIIKDGREKVFRARCQKCATDFEYETEDIQEAEPRSDGAKSPADLIAETALYPRVVCPVCGSKAYAARYTEEEIARVPPFFTGWLGGQNS